MIFSAGLLSVDPGITEELLQSRPMIQRVIDGFSQRRGGDFRSLSGFALLKEISGQENGFLSGDPSPAGSKNQPAMQTMLILFPFGAGAFPAV